MSDEMFDVDAHNPDHWRFYGRRAYAAECQVVLSNGGPSAMTVGDVQAKALANLKARHFPMLSKPEQTP